MNEENKNKDRDVAAVSYVPFICLVALYKRRDSEFIQFHAKQGTVIFILTVLAYILGEFNGLFYLLRTIMYIALLSAVVIGFVTATQGEKHGIPIIKDFVETGWDIKKIFKKFEKLISYLKRIMKNLSKDKENKNKDNLKKENKDEESI